MTPVTVFKGQRIAVFGLGKSGIASAKALQTGGAEVEAWDDAPASREQAERDGVSLRDLKSADWRKFAALVLAPGVPLTHPAPHWTALAAKQNHVLVIGDMELFFLEREKNAPASPFVAITGTNGKSTTTALIAHILSGARSRSAAISARRSSHSIRRRPGART
jgi:UDP-N-acetylmuramoylalanine--D-glutamate ligase